jgi:hypothetical protein
MYFNEHFDTYFDNRESKHYDDKMVDMKNVPWTSELASADGAHYHAWFPKCKSTQLAKLKSKFKKETSWHGDPVSFSYSWIPEGADLDNELCTMKHFINTNTNE